jgi:SAM-dependent methyltransferase
LSFRKSKESSIPNYSDQAYWEDRYASSGDSSKGWEHFDWYLDYEAYGMFLQKEMESTRRLPFEKLRVLVPGCGDSLLCEEIIAAERGIFEVVGIDFSTSSVNMMNSRSKSLGLDSLLTYRVGDLTNLKLESDSSFDFIVDKATLDAIATVNASSDSPHVDNIMKYMYEMWRVLSLHGRFVLITTMPPNVFGDMVGNFLYTFLAETGISTKHPISNWQQGHGFKEVEGRNGMRLFLYSLVKIRDRDDERSLVKKSISRMVEAAKEELLDSKLMGENQEEAELAEIDAVKGASHSWSNGEDDLPLEFILNTRNRSLESINEKYKCEVSQIEDSTRVFLEVVSNNQNDYYAARQVISVRYWINGSWDENDVIRVVMDATHSSENAFSEHLFYSKQENCFETFEYTAEPNIVSPDIIQEDVIAAVENSNMKFLQWWEKRNRILSSNVWKGEIQLTLPDYAGIFRVEYLRSLPKPISLPRTVDLSTAEEQGEQLANINGLGKSVYLSMAATRTISVRGKVSPGNSDNRNSSNLPKSLLPLRLSRRKAGAVQATVRQCDVFVEQLLKVRKLQMLVGINSPMSSSAASINRVMAWLEPLYTVTSETQLKLIIEFDYILLSSSSIEFDTAVSTEYINLSLSALPFGSGEMEAKDWWTAIDWTTTELEVLQNSAGNNLISIRIPMCSYPSDETVARSNVSLSLIDASCREYLLLSQMEKSHVSPLLEEIRCKFCSNALVRDCSLINGVHPLPTGIFNEMLYDFVCCEEASCMSLQCEDLLVKPQKLYCSLTSCWLHREHFIACSASVSPIRLVCKESQSFQDMFTVTGATVMANKSLAPKGAKESERTRWMQRLFTGIVNTDFCSVRCRRCDAWLGDARIDMTALDEDTTEDTNVDSSYEFPLTSLRHIEFSWHTVSIQTNSHEVTSSRLENISILQLAGRLALYVMEKFAKPLICFYLSSSSPLTSDRPVIILKLLSKESGASVTSELNGNIRVRVNPAVKLTYLMGNASEIVRGSEVRIPLEVQDFTNLRSFLQALGLKWDIFHQSVGSMTFSKERICFIEV